MAPAIGILVVLVVAIAKPWGSDQPPATLPAPSERPAAVTDPPASTAYPILAADAQLVERDGPLAPGRWFLEVDLPDSPGSRIYFSVPEGWSAGTSMTSIDDGGLIIQVHDVFEVVTDLCASDWGGLLARVGPSVSALATTLSQLPPAQVEGPVETWFGGYPALRFELRIPDECLGVDGGFAWFNVGLPGLDLSKGDTATVYVVEVGRDRLVLTGRRRSAGSQAELDAVLGSIAIEPAPRTGPDAQCSGQRGPIDAGPFSVPWANGALAVTMPAGWSWMDGGATLYRYDPCGPGPRALEVDIFGSALQVPIDICGSAAVEPPIYVHIGQQAADLVDAIVRGLGPAATEPVDSVVAGLPARRLDIIVDDCRGGPEGRLIWRDNAERGFGVLRGGSGTLHAADIDGKRLVIGVSQRGASEEDLHDVEGIIASIRVSDRPAPAAP